MFKLFYVYSSVILLQYYLPLGHCACINLIFLYPPFEWAHFCNGWTHILKNHQSESTINESQFKTQRVLTILKEICQCKMQSAGYCFHLANENMTTIVPLFSNPRINSLQSAVHSLHFILSQDARTLIKPDNFIYLCNTL